MKTSNGNRRRRGFVSLVLVLSTSTVLLLLTVYAYKRAINAHSVQSRVQLRVDYAEKEEAILRGIVAITPNRAIRAMQQDSNLNAANRNPLRWQDIFSDSLDLANSRTSVSGDMINSLNIPDLKVANTGDSALLSTNRIFKAIGVETGYVSRGVNRSLGSGYPDPLTSNHTTTTNRDRLYPIISDRKYDPAAPAGFGPQAFGQSKFGLLRYPDINFGYAQPGEDFVAKRNWWAFSLDVAGNDSASTQLARSSRNFVMSIYEIPSQLAISAASFMSLGTYGNTGELWQNVTIAGGMFVGKAEVTNGNQYSSLASRRGMTMANGTSIGGQTFAGNPFAAGLREAYQVTEGQFFPVSLASESGRAAFIPISRGKEIQPEDTDGNGTVDPGEGREIFPFFDRFANTDETNVLSTTNWNDYSSGAEQCAMQLDVVNVVSATNQTPTMLRLRYLMPDGTRGEYLLPQDTSTLDYVPADFTRVCGENQSYTFNEPVDLAYGEYGGPNGSGFAFLNGRSGTIRFDNATFGDPNVGQPKSGYWRPRASMGNGFVDNATGTQTCITVYPERIPALLASLGAADTSVNHSLVVNVDYSNVGPTFPLRPQIEPCRDTLDYGVILEESRDLTGFPRGFSLVTNLRLYFGDDFNTVPTTPPTGYTPAITASNPEGRFLPPCSLFAPEKRYLVDPNYGIELKGQIGSLAKVDKVYAADEDPTLVRPMDSRDVSGTNIGANRITINLSPISHPAELPPVTMMNWLVLLEERRNEFFEAP